MNVISLSLILSVMFSFADTEDIFFRNIKEKNKSQQLILLQKRMKKDSTSKNRLTTKENTIRYLEINENREEKFRFISELVGSSSQETFKDDTFTGVFSYCQYRLASCMPHIKKYLDCNVQTGCKINTKDAEILFVSENLDVIVNFPTLFENVLKYDGADLELAKTLYRHAVNFSFLDSAEKILKSFKAIEADPVVKQYICTYHFLKKEYAQSIDCAISTKDPWAKLIIGYVTNLKNEKINQEEYETLLKDLVGYQLLRPRLFAIAMSGLLLNKILEEISDFDLQSLGKDYWNGYILLASNKKKNFLNAQTREKLEQYYLKNFPDSLLVKIYQDKESVDVLKKSLGENSFLYQASK